MVLESWRDQHPLEGSIWKLQRAKKHLEAIDGHMSTFLALDPHRLICELNADKTLWEVRLEAHFPPFVDFGYEIGEFCYQVRSALDHIIFALSEFPSGLSVREMDRAVRKPAFPILQERNNGVMGSNLSYIRESDSSRIKSVVDSKQPYQRGDRDAASLDPLTLLDELGNIDKHRVFRLLPVTLTIERADLKSGIRTVQSTNAGHGDVIAWLPADLDPEVDFYPRVTANVFLPVTRFGGGVFMDNLGRMYEHVRKSILPDFEQFFPALPPSLSTYRDD